jgi:hypothetical protein
VFNAALGREQKVTLADALARTDLFYVVQILHLRPQRGTHRKDSSARAPKGSEQPSVFDFRLDVDVQLMREEPVVQTTAQRDGDRRQHEPGLFERTGEFARERPGDGRRGVE